ncbi:MAG: BatA and WFA domain-containing protein [Bacteroidales bacterium]|nr:BatA and WFA domain-containing protein [Bacteroidales bacterium]
MDFLYPNMLYALFALIIPIIIHLFNFRRHKTVYFSNTSILKTIEQENKKTKKLKDIIVLIMRMLFIAALVVAFAYPYKKNNNAINNNVDNLIAVYIDNSMSMQSFSSEKTLFDDARSSAVKLVENLNQAQKFVLLSNDRNPVNEYPMNKDEMLIRLNEIQSESAPATFENVYNSLQFIKKKNNFKSASLFVYSDFQKNMMKVDELKNDTTIQIVVFPLKSDFQNNIYTDSVWLQSPVLQKNLTNEINARVVNETPNDIKGLPVNFSLDGNVVAYTTVDVVANSHSDVNMQFVIENDGDRKAKVAIQDSPITFDDEYNLVLKVRPSINVVEIANSQQPAASSQSSYLELLFEGDALVNYQAMSPYNIDQNVINSAQMIVLDAASDVNATLQQSLLDFAAQGGSLLVFNNEETENALLYDKLGIASMSLDDNVSKIEYVAKQNAFFDDVFVKFPENAALPEVRKHIRFDIRSNKVLNIASLQNGDPFIMMSRVEKGRAFVVSAPLDEEWSELANHALFVPLMYKMAFVGGGVSDLSYTLGRDKYLNINDVSLIHDDRIGVRSENGLYETFPLVENRSKLNYLYFFEDLPASGFYDIYKNEEYVSTMAWNDNRNESEMSFYEKDDISKIFKDKELNLLAAIDCNENDADDMMEVVVRDAALWKIFIVMALISLLIEILVLRFWK